MQAEDRRLLQRSKPRAGGKVGLARKVAFLRQPESYPEGPSAIEVIETHMSWVFLTDRFVYKLKKPVRHAFLDFSSLAARRHDCEEELRLNRRLAPDVYLGIVALRRDAAGAMRFGDDGEVIEWLVRMRRLPAERMLDNLLLNQAVTEADIAKLARLLARFYRAAEPAGLEPAQYRRRFIEDVEANFEALATPAFRLPRQTVERVGTAQLGFLEQAAGEIEARVGTGRVIEAHGDLRPEHICLLDPPKIIDCLEFNRDFRLLDAADELAFLAMECDRLDAPFVGRVLFATYAAETGDRPPQRLIDFYKSYRAGLRAKLAIWHIREPGMRGARAWRELARQYLRLADDYLRRSGLQ